MTDAETGQPLEDDWLAKLIDEELPKIEREVRAERQAKEVVAILYALSLVHAGLELNGRGCPICKLPVPHVEGCPVARAWALCEVGERSEIRERAQAFAASQDAAGKSIDRPC